MCVTGLPTATSRNTGQACYCDAANHACPDRKHHLWDCPIAAAVVAEMCTCLGIPHLQRHHVWLMHMPDQMLPAVRAHGVSSGVQRALHEVWIVVCLAAVHTMWCTANGPTWSTCYGSTTKGPPCSGTVQSAVAQFWELLHEFTLYSKIPGAWRRLLPQDTP
jgi:hypothetical protein